MGLPAREATLQPRTKTVQRVRHGDVCSLSPVSQYSGATRFGDFWIDRTRVEAVLGGSTDRTCAVLRMAPRHTGRIVWHGMVHAPLGKVSSLAQAGYQALARLVQFGALLLQPSRIAV